MFSLLSPFSLWLGAAIAIPMAIHFLGRQRLKRQPFPSLLLVRERFSKSMNRHRLKNLLLLIIRTLLILCLLLALGNPALQAFKATAAKPDLSLALVNNGIYGALPLQGDRANLGNVGNTGNGGHTLGAALEGQRTRLRAMDSAAGTRTEHIALIADGAGTREFSERFGDYGEAVPRLLAALGSRPGTVRIHIPVFAWADVMPARDELARALKDNPGLQIVLTDYGDAGAKVSAFIGMKAMPAADAPLVKIRARINPSAPSGGDGKVRVYLNGRLFQEQAPAEGNVEVTLPVGEGSRTLGRLSMAQGGFAAAELHFCFPDAGQWVMAHAGSVMASLPSLGRETYFRRIIHVAGGKDIPWSGASPTGGKNAPKSAAISSLKLVYLANERGVDPAAYSRAVEFVKGGGRLIIGVGQESDIPTLNRFLLQPLRLGRLGNLVESPSSAAVSVDRAAMAGLGKLPTDLGALGGVRKRFAFLPDSGTDILLSQAASSTESGAAGTSARANAVLAMRDFHRGKVLLWTTDIDDLNWSDLGVNPFTPLLHQALQQSGSEDRARNLSVASDSIMTLTLDGDESGPALSADVLDPEGRSFTKVRRDGRRLHIGPFDRLGIHRVIMGGDTTAFAVNLAGTTGSVSDPAKGGADWDQENGNARNEFMKAFEPFQGRLSVVSEADQAAAGTTVRALWPALFLASILLLFLEGLIASTFSLRRSRT